MEEGAGCVNCALVVAGREEGAGHLATFLLPGLFFLGLGLRWAWRDALAGRPDVCHLWPVWPQRPAAPTAQSRTDSVLNTVQLGAGPMHTG
jgi:hypothetical protein